MHYTKGSVATTTRLQDGAMSWLAEDWVELYAEVERLQDEGLIMGTDFDRVCAERNGTLEENQRLKSERADYEDQLAELHTKNERLKENIKRVEKSFGRLRGTAAMVADMYGPRPKPHDTWIIELHDAVEQLRIAAGIKAPEMTR